MKKDSLQKTAEGIVLLQEARREIEILAKSYDKMVDEAAQLGEDAYSDQLLVDQLELYDFISDLKFLELQIKTTALTSKAFNSLYKLPAAVRECRGLLSKGPNLSKMGKSLAKFKNDLQNGRKSLKDLRKEIMHGSVTADERILGVAKAEEDPRLKAAKEAREIRLSQAQGGSAVTSPSDIEIDVDIDSIDSILDREKKK